LTRNRACRSKSATARSMTNAGSCARSSPATRRYRAARPRAGSSSSSNAFASPKAGVGEFSRREGALPIGRNATVFLISQQISQRQLHRMSSQNKDSLRRLLDWNRHHLTSTSSLSESDACGLPGFGPAPRARPGEKVGDSARAHLRTGFPGRLASP
jgi:hypothetical protein